MKLMMTREQDYLVPVPEHAEAFDKVPRKKLFEVEIVAKRNLKFMRKFMAMVGHLADADPGDMPKDVMLEQVKLAADHFDMALNPVTGEYYPVTRSISFASMEEGDFAAFYEKAIQGAIWNIIPRMGLGEEGEQSLVLLINEF